MRQLLRLFSDHVRVQLEPPITQVGSILVPDIARANAVRTGVILDVGPGKYVKTRKRGTSEYRDVLRHMEAKKGERVAFLIGSVDTKSGKAVSHYLQEDERVIREDDILFVFEDGADVKVSL